MKLILDLTKEELEALSGFIDAGVRSNGIRSIHMAYILINKLQNAIDNSSKEDLKKE